MDGTSSGTLTASCEHRQLRLAPLGKKPGGLAEEAYIHNLLRPWQVVQEWYWPSPEVIAWVLSLPILYQRPPGWPPPPGLHFAA
jgi:hypothetical protein